MKNKSPQAILEAIMRMLPIKVPGGPPLPYKRAVATLRTVRKGLDRLIAVLEREARKQSGRKGARRARR